MMNKRDFETEVLTEKNFDFIRKRIVQVLPLHRISNLEEAIKIIMHETFTKAWKGWHAFRREAKVETWLYRIATNASYDFLRQVNKNPEVSGMEDFFLDLANTASSEIPSPEDQLIEQEIVELGKAFLQSSCNPTHLRAMQMSIQEGVPLRKIAKELDTSEVALKSAALQIKKRLFQWMEKEGLV